jgi:hypothetical protein
MPAQHHAINRHAPARIDELTTQMLATAGVQRDAKVLDLQPEVRIHLPPARSQQRTLWLPGGRRTRVGLRVRIRFAPAGSQKANRAAPGDLGH